MTNYDFIDPDKPYREENTDDCNEEDNNDAEGPYTPPIQITGIRTESTDKGQQQEQQEDSRGFLGRVWEVLRG